MKILIRDRWDHDGSWSVLERLFNANAEVWTDTDGAYVFHGIDVHRKGSFSRKVVWATHFSGRASLIHAVPVDDATMDFVLLGAGSIEGTVKTNGPGPLVLHVLRPDEPGFSRIAQCDKDGEFKIRNVPAGAYKLAVTTVGNEMTTTIDIHVVPNEVSRIQVTVPLSSVRLTLRVPAGRGKAVVITPTNRETKSSPTIYEIVDMGTEELSRFDVEPGGYRVSLDGRQWMDVSVERSPAEQTVDLRGFIDAAPHMIAVNKGGD